MKFNKIILPSIALATIMASCDDQIMEWQDKDNTVDASELPLTDNEKLKLYKPIKEYVAQYHPNLNLALGIGADMYLDDADAKALIDANFTGITLGNAMKMGVMVNASGNIDYTTVDNVLAAMPAGMKLYGHNLLWHTQQPQTYLKSLIAPEMKVVVDQNDVCVNVIGNSGFEENMNGWISWSHHTKSLVSPGYNSNQCLKLSVDNTSTNSWHDQLFWTLDTPLVPGETYAYQFWARTDNPGAVVQFMYQNTANGNQDWGANCELASNWVLFTGEVILSDEKTDVTRVGLQFGGMEADIYIDDFKFGIKNEGPANLCENGNFSNGTTGWTINNASGGVETVELADAPSGNKNVLKMVANDAVSNAWDLQVISPKIPNTTGADVEISFYVKSDIPGKGRLSFSGDMSNQWPWMNWTGNQSGWTEAFETGTGWTYIKVIPQKFSCDFNEGTTTWQFNLDFGYMPGVTYYIDNVLVTEVADEPAPAILNASRAGGITYIPKSAEEKKTILLDAMEQWIKSIMEHVGDRVDAWDVINEPIADGSNGWRGIDGVFGSNNNDGVADSEPVETETDGLTLNWASEAGNQHWYWGYYLGKDYAVKAFEFARKYAPNAKLFVNEYNLETSPSKLDALIGFVNYIDQNGGQVDGIGTQMHVNYKISKEQVDAMFKKLAQTGKLIRITELDVAFGVEEGKTITPSEAQLSEQAATYQMILTSYFENIPEAQQSSITIWGFSDNKKEHEYWLPGDAPNLFDGDYNRKIAYKGVCDAIAGYDVSTDFKGEEWKDLHEGEEGTPAE